MQDIKDLTLEELEKTLKGLGQSAFHAKQVFAWIYKRQASEFVSMTDLPLGLREKLKEKFYIYSLKSVKKIISKDRSGKILLELKDKNLIEAVLIPAQRRITGCISTQVGCKFSCWFCASGLLGFKRNLTPAEMIEEILYLKKNIKNKKLTHLVFMGMGEPLDNYDNVLKTIRIINSAYALNIGARRITISTCGIIPAIKKLAHEALQIELSISLHAADDKLRSRLMPINKKYPLNELLAVCKEYTEKTNRQITFEYILIKRINSSLQNAKELSKILSSLKICKVNLIPANPVKECTIEPPKQEEMLLFRDYLINSGINVTLRKPRGQDIQAACGQLMIRYEKK